MKNNILILIILSISIHINAQSLIGAWETATTSDDGEQLRNVVIFADGYQVSAWYKAANGAFISTNGGSWKLKGNMMTEVVEFDTENPDNVGDTHSFEIVLDDSTLGIAGNEMEWQRVDNGKPGALQGAWLMSGRIRDGKRSERDTSRPRKTMKILSGTRFQWIAYNTETKEFMGTGGGTYTTADGKYTENIEFFSRDNSKAGLSLEFNFELIDGDWHHSGKSSKGDPIYEIWSMRK